MPELVILKFLHYLEVMLHIELDTVLEWLPEVEDHCYLPSSIYHSKAAPPFLWEVVSQYYYFIRTFFYFVA